MINDGADPLQVKRPMGHEDIRTTYNLYGHLFPDREEQLVTALDRRRNSGRARHLDQMWTKSTATVVELAAT